MGSPTIRFTQPEQKKTPRTSNVYEDRTFDTSYLLRADTAHWPTDIAFNCALYNTDTGELFFGKGEGREPIAVTNKTYEKQIKDLVRNTYTKAEIDQFIDNDIDLDGIVDRLNLYTVQKIDELVEEKGNEIIQLRQDIDSLLQSDYVTKESLEEDKQHYYTKEEVNRLINRAVTDVLTAITNMIQV